MRKAGKFLLAAIVVGTFWFGIHFRAAQQKRQREAATLGLNRTLPQTLRKVYPYSVIPGGAYTAEELALARRVDPVVAAHYSDFGGAVIVRTAALDSYMYVSYRKSDHVYWTASRRRIPKGELLLTDGTNLARTRCGNRLSLNPQQPTLPKEPTDIEFDAPEPLAAPTLSVLSKPPIFPAEAYVAPNPGLLDGNLPVPTPFASSVGNANPLAQLLSAPLSNQLFLPPVAYISNSPQNGTQPSGGTTPITTVPVTTISDIAAPESGSLQLILLAGAGMLSCWRFARKRR